MENKEEILNTLNISKWQYFLMSNRTINYFRELKRKYQLWFEMNEDKIFGEACSDYVFPDNYKTLNKDFWTKYQELVVTYSGLNSIYGYVDGDTYDYVCRCQNEYNEFCFKNLKKISPIRRWFFKFKLGTFTHDCFFDRINSPNFIVLRYQHKKILKFVVAGSMLHKTIENIEGEMSTISINFRDKLSEDIVHEIEIPNI